MKLIYHQANQTRGISPFDEALVNLSKEANPLYLASPYIGLAYLLRITDRAVDWKLLSDIEAWLQSGNRKHRAHCWDFILKNLDHIRHVPDLHAKIAIGNNHLFVGSANFTEKGILGRTEMSVLIDDPATVSESIDWFNSIWVSATPPIIEEGDELVSALDEVQWTTTRSRKKLTSTTARVTAVLSDSIRPAGFDVAAAMAKAGIAESRRLQSLEEAYREVSDAWYSAGTMFTFAELKSEISKVYERPTSTAVWDLLITDVANHHIGGLRLEGYDRYIHEDGTFHNWTPSAHSLSSHIDRFLCFVIDTIPVSPEHTYLPTEGKWLDIGIAEAQILHLVDELIEAGLLIENDIAGDIEQYSIDPLLEWPGRWNKFPKAKAAYHAKLSHRQLQEDEVEDEDEFEDEPSNFMADLKLRSEIRPDRKDPGLDKLKQELVMDAKRLGIDPEQLRLGREDVLIASLELIESRLPQLSNQDIESLTAEMVQHNLPSKIVNQFRFFNGGAFSHHKKKNKVELSRIWLATHHLALYPKALKKWKLLTKY